jgi:hypothetical protein
MALEVPIHVDRRQTDQSNNKTNSTQILWEVLDVKDEGSTCWWGQTMAGSEQWRLAAGGVEREARTSLTQPCGFNIRIR